MSLIRLRRLITCNGSVMKLRPRRTNIPLLCPVRPGQLGLTTAYDLSALPEHQWNKLWPWRLCRLKESSMRIVFIVLVASVLSILGFKYMDRSIGDTKIMASPAELSATS
jgi:hypothetical protein